MNAKADIWMPFYIGDYFADTMHLNAEQHGAYLLLLFTYWKRRRPLPNDPVFLANAARLSSDAWSIHQAVLKEFFDTSSGNAWVHHRVESELLKATDKKQKAAEKAKKAAEGRWKNASSNAPSITQAMLKECPSPSPSPSSNKSSKEDLSPADAEDDQGEVETAKPEKIPYQEIVNLYHEVLPEKPRVARLNDNRRRSLKARFLTTQKTRTLEWWRDYFKAVRERPFLMNGKGDWPGADFDFLITESKFLKIIEGGYL